MLKGIFGPERDREREGGRGRERERGTKEMQDEEVHNLYFSPKGQHNETNKSTVSGIWNNRGVYRNSVKILVGVPN
jgi:cytochrome oxidase Cu insertion factor (SCO1/SenC/PrrC family)